MPIYEQKLISPLALRFTQEHIRTTFRCGRTLEETIAEIRVDPGVGDYDVILRVPFPLIEIIRWNPSTREAKPSLVHWYTLDNRRLYCLQKIAAEHWPKRVGVAVDILYADPGAVKKKYDSTTFGGSVTISPSTRDPPTCRWDWRSATFGSRGNCHSDKVAFENVTADDKKASVDALMDAPAEITTPASSETSHQNDWREFKQQQRAMKEATPVAEEQPAPSPLVALLAMALKGGGGASDQAAARCRTPSTDETSGSEDKSGDVMHGSSKGTEISSTDSGNEGSGDDSLSSSELWNTDGRPAGAAGHVEPSPLVALLAKALQQQQLQLQQQQQQQHGDKKPTQEEEEPDADMGDDLYELAPIPQIAKGLDLVALLKLPPFEWEATFVRTYEANKIVHMVVKAMTPPPEKSVTIAGSAVYVRGFGEMKKKQCSAKESSGDLDLASGKAEQSQDQVSGNAEQSRVPFTHAKGRNFNGGGKQNSGLYWKPKVSA
jgi:hypothetical protein